MRLPILAVLAALLAPFAFAQTPCEGGTADGYECDRVTLLARMDFDALTFGYDQAIGRRGNDIWGWTDPDTGREYALTGHYDGVAFVDVSTPTAPVLVGVLPSAVPGSSGNLWRDIKTHGTYAFVVSEASGHGMQVFDLTRLRDVTAPPATFDADARYTGASGVHNVVADESLDVVALVGYNDFSGGGTCGGGGLHLVDVSDPLDPTYAGCYDEDGYTHDAQCLRYDGPDTDYVGRDICLSSNADELSISDITDPANAEGISIAIYDDPGYTHQGWLTEDRRFFILNDELDEAFNITATTRTIVMNVEDLDDPFFVGAFFSDVESADHNLYIRGDVIYQSNYESGLRLFRFDSDNPLAFEPLGYFDTYPASTSVSFNGAWSVYPFFESGTVVVSDRENGLFILRPEIEGVSNEDALPESAARLSAAYPNPFSATTRLVLTLAAPEHVRAHAYDLLGRHVATLLDGTVDAATLTLDGARLPGGTYVVRVTGETFADTRRVTLTR